MKQKDPWLRYTVISLIIFVLTVVIANIYIYLNFTESLHKEIVTELNSVSTFRTKELSSWYQNTSQLPYQIAKNQLVQNQIYQAYLNKRSIAEDSDLNYFLKGLITDYYFSGVMIIDTNYNVLYNFNERNNKNNVVSEQVKDLTKELKQNRYAQRIKDIKEAKDTQTRIEKILSSKSTFMNMRRTEFIFTKDDGYLEIVFGVFYIDKDKFEHYGYMVFLLDLNQSLKRILADFTSGERFYHTAFYLQDYNSPGMVYEAGLNSVNLPYLVKRKTNIPFLANYNLQILWGEYEGYDKDNEYVYSKIVRLGYTSWALMTKVNLSSYFEYKKYIAIYLIIFSLFLIFSAIFTAYLLLRHHKNLRIEEAYNLLVDKQAYQIRYETLLKNASDCIMLFNDKTYIVEYNERASQLYGYDHFEMQLLNIRDLWDESIEQLIKEYQNSDDIKNGIVFESVNKRKDKVRFPVEVSIRKIEIDSKIFYQAIIRDITERKKNEAEILSNKEKYQNLVENINDVLFTVKENGIISYISPVISHILLYNHNEMINTSFKNYVYEEDYKTMFSNNGVMFSKETKNINLRLVKKDNQISYCKISTRSVVNKKGEIVITGVLTDLTKETQLQILLDKEKEDLKTIIDLSPIAIFFKDKNNNYLRVNKAAEATTEFTIDQITGQSASVIFPNSYKKYYMDDLEILATKKPKFGILEKFIVKGKELYYRSDKVPWFNEKGEVAGIICFSVNITEQRKAEEALQKEKNLLQWILTTIPVGVMYINKFNEIEFGNMSAEKIFNCRFDIDEKLQFTNPKLGFCDESGRKIELHENPFNKVITKLLPIRDVNVLYKQSKDTVRFLSINASPLLNEKFEFEGVVSSIEDITEKKLAENLIKESEEKYRSLFEGMQEGFGFHKIIYDEDGKPIDYIFLEVNPAFERITGLKSADILGKKATDILPNIEATWIEDYGKVSLQCQSVEFERYSIALNKYFRVSAFSNVKDYFATVFEDITERKNIETALRVSEDRFRQVAENTNDWIWEVNADGLYTFSTASVEKLTGYSVDEVVGKMYYYDFFPDESRDEMVKAVQETINLEGRLFRSVNPNKHKDGTIILIETTGSAIFDADRNIIGFRGADTDVTKSMQTQKELIELKNKYSKAFYTSPDAISIVRLSDYSFIDVNIGFTKNLGYGFDEIIGTTSEKVKIWNSKSDKKEFFYLIEHEGSVKNKEAEFKRKDGSILVGLISAVVIELEGENCVLSIIRDITARKAIENELNNYKDNLERMVALKTKELFRANVQLKEEIEKEKAIEAVLEETLQKEKNFSELKTRFISTASHEFRTPLATMLSSTELLESYGYRWDEKKLKEHIARIKGTIEHMTDLINDVLSVSRVESGKISFNPIELNLEDFCNRIIEDARVQYGKTHTIVYEYLAADKKFLLDDRLLNSIFVNLLSNAVKYSSIGEVVTFKVSSDTKKLTIEVKDNGIGISQEDMPYLFEPFHRGNNVNQITGTGLGMSIVKRYVELHNGEVFVESGENKGTKITVIIPIK